MANGQRTDSVGVRSVQSEGVMAALILDDVLTETELVALAGRICRVLATGDCVGLCGDLGAGKTTFARALIRAYVADPLLDVPSPTFALRQDYTGARGPIVHFDLYRIANPRDLDEIGFEDTFAQAVTVVEWPDRAGGALPSSRIDITLSDTASSATRRVAVAGDAAVRSRLSCQT